MLLLHLLARLEAQAADQNEALTVGIQLSAGPSCGNTGTTNPVKRSSTTTSADMAPPVCSVQPPTQTHAVEVGPHGQLLFNPSQVDAAIGDEIRFQFHMLNHTLIQSTLQNPCSASGRFDTGFTRFNPNDHLGSIISFVVEQPNPQVFFCRQDNPRPQCQAGMVFAINPGDFMNEFLENARTQPTETASKVQSTGTTQSVPSLTSAVSQPGPPGLTTGTMGSSNSGTASVSQPDSPTFGSWIASSSDGHHGQRQQRHDDSADRTRKVCSPAGAYNFAARAASSSNEHNGQW